MLIIVALKYYQLIMYVPPPAKVPKQREKPSKNSFNKNIQSRCEDLIVNLSFETQSKKSVEYGLIKTRFPEN